MRYSERTMADDRTNNVASETLVLADGDNQENLFRVRRTKLLVISGPLQGREFVLNRDTFTIGSGSHNDLTIEDSTVSKRHCEIVVEQSGYLIRDLDSTNGTFVQGVRVSSAHLAPGSEIQLGKTRIVFCPLQDANDIPLSRNEAFGAMLGRSVPMRRIFYLAETYSPADVTVMITGETGTGKEILAEEIHNHSNRRDKPFIVIDCAAISKELIESELFGHVKGAFTGANADRQGAFELADGGTVFLDEIGDLSPDLQPKLLRVLEKREIRRVGENKTVNVDVRVVCATNRNLEEMVVSDEFREDLWFRVNTFEIPLPPLRERPDDIPRLARHLAGRFRKVPPDADIFAKDALAALSEHDWPGNVRELVNVIEHAMILCDDLPITPEHLPSRLTLRRPRSIAGAVRVADHSTKSLREIEMDAIFEALERCGGNKPKAAEQLGVSLKTLYNKLNQVSGLEKSA